MRIHDDGVKSAPIMIMLPGSFCNADSMANMTKPNKTELPSTFSVAGSSALVTEAVLQLFVFRPSVYSFRRIYVMTPSLEVKTSAVLPSSSTISYAPGVTVSAAEFMAI